MNFFGVRLRRDDFLPRGEKPIAIRFRPHDFLQQPIGAVAVAGAVCGVKGFQASLWVGFMAPAGTPQPIVEQLNREINKILARADIKTAWGKQGANPLTMTQPQFKTFMESEIAKWSGLIKANNIPAIN